MAVLFSKKQSDDLESPDYADYCENCGEFECVCDTALFDADELGLDPEDDQDDPYWDEDERN